MKTNFPILPATRTTSGERSIAANFSHRMARPSVGRTFASLNSSLRVDDLWDYALIDRLHPPLTRRHY